MRAKPQTRSQVSGFACEASWNCQPVFQLRKTQKPRRFLGAENSRISVAKFSSDEATMAKMHNEFSVAVALHDLRGNFGGADSQALHDKLLDILRMFAQACLGADGAADFADEDAFVALVKTLRVPFDFESPNRKLKAQSDG